MKRFLKADQTRAACYIHDFQYYIFEILYGHKTVHRKFMRQVADVYLRWNRTLIGNGWWSGQIVGRLYYRGVRTGGGRAANKAIDELAVPPNTTELDKIQRECEYQNDGELTERAENIIELWRKKSTPE